MKKLKSIVLLLVCSVVYFMFAVGSGTNVKTSSDAQGTVSEVHKLDEYHLNEDIFIDGGSGKYRIKFTNVYETDDRNMFDDSNPDRVIVIEYEYENLTKDSYLLVSDWDFKAYDIDNNKLESYPVSTKYGGSVSKGRKATSSMAYGFNNGTNRIELEHYDNMFNDKADCKIVLDW